MAEPEYFESKGVRVIIMPRMDGKFKVYWREGGSERSTTITKHDKAVAKAKKELKRLTTNPGGRMVTIGEAEMLDRLKELAGERLPNVWLDDIADAQERLKGRVSLKQVVDYYEGAGMLHSTRVLLRDAKHKFLHEYAEGSLETYNAFNKILNRLLKRYPDIVVCDLTAEMVRAICAEKKGGKASAKTYNNRLGYIKTFLNKCQEPEWKMIPPGETVADLVKKKSEGESIPAIFSVETAQKALNVLKDYLLPTFIVGCWMGPRPQAELRSIHWEHFDWKMGYLEITMAMAGKTSRHRFVPIPSNVKAMLKPWIDAGATGPISGKAHVGEISKALKEKGVIGSWPTDVMRHSYISYMIALGHPVGRVAEWAGNSERQIKKSYRRPLRKPDGEKWFAIGLKKFNLETSNIKP